MTTIIRAAAAHDLLALVPALAGFQPERSIVCVAFRVRWPAHRADYLTFAGESTAYRFFFVYRLANDEQSNLYLPQGYLTTLLQRIAYQVVVPGGDLRDRLQSIINRWGMLSAALTCATGMAALMIGMAHRSLPPLAISMRPVGASPGGAIGSEMAHTPRKLPMMVFRNERMLSRI